jgi:uncharacterized protein (DUF433 family)
MDLANIVHSHPEIVSGELVFVGTRVPARNLLEWLEGGHTLHEFLDNFPSVSRNQAIAFLAQATEALRATPPGSRSPDQSCGSARSSGSSSK